MRKLIIAAVLMCSQTVVFAGPSDAVACKQATQQYSAQGMTMKDCLCMLGEAGKYMTPQMKQAFVSSLMAQQPNPMSDMMSLGMSLNDLMASMQAYAAGLEANCGLR